MLKSNMLTYLDDTLGLKIHPPDVRLIPNATDPYSWGPIPGKETMFKDILFAKHLSKLSIGPLMELCRGVGKTFRAIKPADLPPDCSHKSDAKVERGRLFQEENDIVQDMRRRLRGYKRKHKILWDHIEKQDALIAKYRAAAQAIVQQPIVQQLPQLL